MTQLFCPMLLLMEPLGQMFDDYLAAFNSGDGAAYARFYAPDVRFANGAGVALRGAQAVVDYYHALKPLLSRTIEARLVVTGERSLAAMLSSDFVVIGEEVPFGGELLHMGDRVALESMALYEVDNSRFARIEARTLRREIKRANV